MRQKKEASASFFSSVYRETENGGLQFCRGAVEYIAAEVFGRKDVKDLQINQIKAGAILSYLSMGLSTVISLVYTPIMIQRLGDSEFGVYQTVLPIISYLNMLTFGLGSAYIRYYSRSKADDDRKAMAKLNGMFLVTYMVLGALVLAIGFLLANHGDIIFGKKLTEAEIALGEKLLRIMTVNAALTFPISVFESHVTIHEQYIFQKVVALGRQVLNPLIMIPLLILGYRSVTLTVMSLAFTVLSGILNVSFCLVKLKMCFSFRRYDFGLMREMVGFTAFVFIGIVVDNVNWSIDRLLLAWIHGTTAVTIYTVAGQLNVYYQSFATAISNLLIPRVNRIVAENRPIRELDRLFIRVGRLQFILLGCIFWGFVAVGRSFVVLWGGDDKFAIDYAVTLVLFGATLWANIQMLGYDILRAKNMHKFSSLVSLAIAVGNIVVSIPLCMKWGVLGAAIGTALATGVGMLVLNRYFRRQVGLDISRFWLRIRHLVPAMVVPGLAAVASAMFLSPTGYFQIAGVLCVFVAVYGASMWLFGMDRYERDLFSGPVKKILRRIKR